jgi:ComF family protein
MRDKLTSWAERLLPYRCLLCGQPGTGLDLCAACQAAMPFNATACLGCALALRSVAHLCQRCGVLPPPWTAAWAPFRYAWPLDLLEARFKFQGDLACGRVLATLWARQPSPLATPDIVVPVPLHGRRLRERGYNQAAELVRPLAAARGIPWRPDALRRQRATQPQSERDAAARRGNVQGAFAAQAVRGLCVAVADDVMTTGATLGECTQALLVAGAREVQVWALARA